MTQDRDSGPENSNLPYNKIFENLVVKTDEGSLERLAGMIAYSEYKLDKHRWKCIQPNPSPEQVDTFLMQYDERRLDKYRREAYQLLLDFAGTYADEVLKDNLEKHKEIGLSQELKALELRLSNKIKENKVSYMKPIWQSYIASWVFAISFPFFALAVWYVTPDNVKQLLPNNNNDPSSETPKHPPQQ